MKQMPKLAQASDETHITSLVVHVLPPHLAALEQQLGGLEGAQVHGRHVSGKLVVTLEAASAGAILERVAQIEGLPGVIKASLVYQHAERMTPEDNRS